MSSSSQRFDDFVVDSDGTVSTKTTNVCSRRSKSSKQKSEFRSHIEYMKNVENGGVSLYTHVRVLIEMFVFQNPIQPIKYFEYYSEKLKEYYHRPRSDLDSEFLNNIELEVCKKITDIQNNKINGDKDKPSYLYYDDDDDDDDDYVVNEYLRYENESDFVDGDVTETETVVQDLSEINYMFTKAGCGITNDEAHLIEIIMNHSSNRAKFKNVRYWGKILGLKRNYYVLECEWQNKELEYKLRALNYLMINKSATFDYENIYENEGSVGELDNEMFSMRLSHEQMIDENKNSSNSLLRLNSKVDEQAARDSATAEMFDYDKSKSTCFPLPVEPTEGDHLSYEMFGFGANKKSYFVTNEVYGEWTELPLLKPHHVIQSRAIKRYFVGDLDSPVESFPQFQGLEKHYLRAQIARITSETQISPRDYFLLGGNHEKSIRTKKLTPFQTNVLSQKHVHDYVINRNYDPLSTYALLKPKNWVHHTPSLSDEGMTNAWTKIRTSEKRDKKESSAATIATSIDEQTDGFSTVSDELLQRCDPHCSSTWKFELTNTFDHRATYVSARSNIWPGAFAITGYNKPSDCTYYGWGDKRDADEFARLVTGATYRSEYPNDAKDTTEVKDPTLAEQLSYVERMRTMREERRRMKNAGMAPRVEGNEEEERVLRKYDYV